jgi:hypothetical protein
MLSHGKLTPVSAPSDSCGEPQKHIDIQDLDSKVVGQFLRIRRRQQRVRRGDPKTLQRMLTMLCQIGIVKPQSPVVDNARSRITNEFRHYLLEERGPSPLTLLNYLPVVEQFLSERFHNRASSRRGRTCSEVL